MTFTRLIFVCLFASALFAERPNVLFLSMDDLKPELGCYGSETVKSPNIDRLAERGMLFEHHYVQIAICSASRASMFTGLRPDRVGVWDIAGTARESNPDAFTMQQYFKEAGYQTAGSGKVMHGFTNNDPLSWSIPFVLPGDLPFVNGRVPALYEQYQGEAIHAVYRLMQAEGIKGYGAQQKFMASHNAKPATECIDIEDAAYSDGAMALWGVEMLEQFAASEDPFFLTLGFRKPHLPFVAPKKYWDLFDRDAIEVAPFQKPAEGAPAYSYQPGYEIQGYSDIELDVLATDYDKQRELLHGYYACVAYIDAQIGLVMDALERTGLAENTIVVLWGDHGWHLGDHGVWCKHTNYEQATRSPLIIVAPDQVTGGVSRSMVESIDIFPTLCELAGLSVPRELQGMSLLPVLKDPAVEVKPYAMSQYADWHRKVFMGYSMRTERYRMITWIDDMVTKDGVFDRDMIDAIELYDYVKDPLETVNLANHPEYASMLETYMESVETFFAETRKSD